MIFYRMWRQIQMVRNLAITPPFGNQLQDLQFTIRQNHRLVRHAAGGGLGKLDRRANIACAMCGEHIVSPRVTSSITDCSS